MTTRDIRASPIREATDIVDIATEAGSLPSITATLTRGNMINRNGRYYSAVELEKAATAAHDRVKAGQLIGLMDHPDFFAGDKGKPERTVIRWSRLWMDGPDLKGEGTILGTALGKDLLALREGGVHIALSTNAYARTSYEQAKHVPAPYDGPEDDLIAVMADIELLGVDVVNNPSNVFAQIHAEAALAREREQEREANEVNEEERKELEAKLAEATTAREAAEKAAQEAQEAREKAEAALVAAERQHVVDTALAGRSVPQAVRDAMLAAANTAENLDAATVAVKALADAYTAGGGNGNNHIPETTNPTVDALAEARTQIGVTA